MSKPIEAVLVGAGNRGCLAYGAYALRHPERFRFVAVVEPDDERRAAFARAHDIPPERQLRSWEELVGKTPLAPAAINATMDRTHHASTLALLEAGYEVLLEKPMATSATEVLDLAAAAERHGRILQIAHVLRHAPFFRVIHELLEAGRLGDVVSLDWRENLHAAHFAHSFIRGNWANAERTSPMILTKCCHDFDLLVWYLGTGFERVASFGSLTHFTAERAGPEIPARCTDGCPVAEECVYDARRIYLPHHGPGRLGEGFVAAVSSELDAEAIRARLETGPYGRCVYRCDNTAVDHQVVLMELAGGPAVSLTMQGASHIEGRTVRIDGTRATLLGNEPRGELLVADHLTGETETIRTLEPGWGHGGGDDGIMDAFIAGLSGDAGAVLTAARESVESHVLAFAAEEARVTGEVVDLAEYRRRAAANSS
jgi:predicted dehydrogenase